MTFDEPRTSSSLLYLFVISAAMRGLVALFWLFVGIPLAWGVWTTVTKALVLFR